MRHSFSVSDGNRHSLYSGPEPSCAAPKIQAELNVRIRAAHIGDIDTPEKMDELLARWRAQIEADNKAKVQTEEPEIERPAK